MGSQSVEILRQGIWASLTGGWFYDPRKPIFCNTFHLYLWLYLVCAPFSIYLSGVGWWAGWIIHLTLLTLLTCVVKCSNYVLHHMFDTSPCHVQHVTSPSTSPQSSLPPPPPPHANLSPALFSNAQSRVQQHGLLGRAGRSQASLTNQLRFFSVRSLEAMELPVVANRSTDDRNSPVGTQNSGRDGLYSAAARRTSGWGCFANNPAVLDYIPPSLAMNRPRIHTPEGGEVSSPPPLSESPDFPTLLGRIHGGQKDGGPPEATSPYAPVSSPAVYPTHPYDVAALNDYLGDGWSATCSNLHVQVHTSSNCNISSKNNDTKAEDGRPGSIGNALNKDRGSKKRNTTAGGRKERSIEGGCDTTATISTTSVAAAVNVSDGEANDSADDVSDDVMDSDADEGQLDASDLTNVLGVEEEEDDGEDGSCGGGGTHGSLIQSHGKHGPFPSPEPPPNGSSRNPHKQPKKKRAVNARDGSPRLTPSSPPHRNGSAGQHDKDKSWNKPPPKPPRLNTSKDAASASGGSSWTCNSSMIIICDNVSSKAQRTGGVSHVVGGVSRRVGVRVSDHPLALAVSTETIDLTSSPENSQPITSNSPLLAPHPLFAHTSKEHVSASKKKKRKRDKKRFSGGGSSSKCSPSKEDSHDRSGRASRLSTRRYHHSLLARESPGSSGLDRALLPSPSRAPSRSGGYQALVCRKPLRSSAAQLGAADSSAAVAAGSSTADAGDGVCTLTFENLYANDEGSSSSDMKHSSSSEENITAGQLPPPPSHGPQQLGVVGESFQDEVGDSEAPLKPLSYPDAALVTGSSASSLLRGNWNNSFAAVEVLSDASQLQSSDTDAEEGEEDDDDVYHEHQVTQEEGLIGEVGAAASLETKSSNDESSKQTAILNNVEVAAGEDRLTSAVNYNVCVNLVRRSERVERDADHICDDSVDQSESSEVQLFSAYENLTHEAFGEDHRSSRVRSGDNKDDVVEAVNTACIGGGRGGEYSSSSSDGGGEASSNPDIDWLFSHSDSDSEFADLAKLAPPPPPNSRAPPEGAVGHCSLDAPRQEGRYSRRLDGAKGNGEEEEEDENSWTMVRSSPESSSERDGIPKGLPSNVGSSVPEQSREALGFLRRHPQPPPSIDAIYAASSTSNKQQLQGAIPKRRRHGVIMDDTVSARSGGGGSSTTTSRNSPKRQRRKSSGSKQDDSLCEAMHSNDPATAGSTSVVGEVSSVTMDLMRRMLDVFSSYPEHCHIDIKKLLVLVSLEQQNSNNRATVTALGGVAGSGDFTAMSGDGSSGRSSSTLPAQCSPPQASPAEPKHSTLPLTPTCSTSPAPTDVTHKLYRKPAVRRRKCGSGGGPGSSASPPVSPLETDTSGGLFRSGGVNCSAAMMPTTTTFPGVTGSDINYQPAVLTQEERRSLSPEEHSQRKGGPRVPPHPHLAASYDDTTAGAVHCYQDEHGKWFTYTFKDTSPSLNSNKTSATPDDPSSFLLPSLLSTPISSSSGLFSQPPGSYPTSLHQLLMRLSAGSNTCPTITTNCNAPITTSITAATTFVTSVASTISSTAGGAIAASPLSGGSSSKGDPGAAAAASDGAVAANGGVSLSSSSMSLCSGLTVILDQQLSSASAPPSNPPWTGGGGATTQEAGGRRRSSGGLVLRRTQTLATESEISCREDRGEEEDEVEDDGRCGERPEAFRPRCHLTLINDPPASEERREPRRRRRRLQQPPQMRTLHLIRNLSEINNPPPPPTISGRNLRGFNFLSTAFQEIRRTTSLSNNNNNNNNSNNNNNNASITAASTSGSVGGISTVPARGSIITSEAYINAITDGLLNEEDEPDYHSLAAQLGNCPPLTKQYYNLNIGMKNTVKVTFDRLALLALLDRNLTVTENIFNVLLTLTVGILGCCVLQLGLYKELEVLIFCVVMASSQYSLFKSVQPDAASPIHGYNRIIIYSRPLYFIFCCSTVLLLQWATMPSQQPLPRFVLYGLNLTSWVLLDTVKTIFLYLLLFFPLLFSLGLLPQVNTFLMYALEQIDIHMFGGNATTSLLSALYCVLRSCLAVACLCGFAYGGLNESTVSSPHVGWSSGAATFHDNDSSSAPTAYRDSLSAKPILTDVTQSTESGQYILYSIFCALLLAVSYHLSRSCADYTTLWQLVQRHVFPDELTSTASPSAADGRRTGGDEAVRGSSSPRAQGAAGAGQNTTSPSTSVDCAQEQPSPLVGAEATTNDGGCKLPDEDEGDPLPEKLRSTVLSRLTHDMLVCSLLALIVLLLHATTALQRVLKHVHPLALWLPPVISGFVLHYIIPQLRKQQPWLCVARPILMQHEYADYEVFDSAKVMWFEKIYVWLCLLEKNVVYPVLFTCALTVDAAGIVTKHEMIGPLLIAICGLKCLRSAYSYPPSQYLILAFTKLFFNYDFRGFSETFLVDYFFMSIVYRKVYEFLLKLSFIVTYIAPWQITWGSAFHAFAQPFSVPHSAMLFLQAAVSALLSTPLNPVLGSAIFITSYVRPVKFWERDYNTKRMDQSNTRLSTSLLDHNPGTDDNNLNSIFYEHLTRSLQHSLCGDLLLGRWGSAGEGDCFVLASDNLNCLVHLTEVGNGIVTFQVRGLEFRGTYCQQREVEAISEGIEEDQGCCCCEPGRLPNLLSGNAAFNQRWLAWEVTATNYVLEGYSISDNSAASMFQMFDLRKILVSYYVKAIIFHVTRHPRLERWLTDPDIQQNLEPLSVSFWADLDPTFHPKIDEDFDHQESGITRYSFCQTYCGWINYCMMEREALDNRENKKQQRQTNTSLSGGSAACTLGKEREDLEKRDLDGRANYSAVRPPTRPFVSGRAAAAGGDRPTASSRGQHQQNKPKLTSSSEVDDDRRTNPHETARLATTSGGGGLGELDERGVEGWSEKHVRQLSTDRSSCSTTGGGRPEHDASTPGQAGDRQRRPVKSFKSDGSVEYDTAEDSALVSLCLALSLLGRRAFGPASHNENVEFFLHGLHSLFRGDFRITCERDEWVFGDMELLRRVVAPAVRMSLKLHLDHFLVPDEFEVHESLYSAMLEQQQQHLVIAHEADPSWRAAVLASRPSLLALRHVLDDGDDKYKIIMLNKRHLLFRVIKVNRECVRGLWAGQQQELVYLRNRNPERGSIQNARQALRNMINSSCDQPIGYPIYVSPLTTSYSHTHPDFAKVGGLPITPALIGGILSRLFKRLRTRCGEGCSSGSSGLNGECGGNNGLSQVISTAPQQGGSSGRLPQDGSLFSQLPGGAGGSLSRGSVLSTSSSIGGAPAPPPSKQQSSTALASLAGLLAGDGTPSPVAPTPRSRHVLQTQPPQQATAGRDSRDSGSLQQDSARDEAVSEAGSISALGGVKDTSLTATSRDGGPGGGRNQLRSLLMFPPRSDRSNSGGVGGAAGGIASDASASLPGLLTSGSLAACRSREWDSSGRVGRTDGPAWLAVFGGSYRDTRLPTDDQHLDSELFYREEQQELGGMKGTVLDIRDGTKDCVREYRELGRQRERREVRAQRRERAREATKDLYVKQSDRRKRSSESVDRKNRARTIPVSRTDRTPESSKSIKAIRGEESCIKLFRNEDDGYREFGFGVGSQFQSENVRINGSEVVYQNNVAGDGESSLRESGCQETSRSLSSSRSLRDHDYTTGVNEDRVIGHRLSSAASADDVTNAECGSGRSSSSGLQSSPHFGQRPSLTTSGPFLTPHSPNINLFGGPPPFLPTPNHRSSLGVPSSTFSSSGSASLPSCGVPDTSTQGDKTSLAVSYPNFASSEKSPGLSSYSPEQNLSNGAHTSSLPLAAAVTSSSSSCSHLNSNTNAVGASAEPERSSPSREVGSNAGSRRASRSVLSWSTVDDMGAGSAGGRSRHSSGEQASGLYTERVTITDANQIYDTLNLGRRIDVLWPDEEMRARGGRNSWGRWVPVEGMEGPVVHRWIPHHPNPLHRSHVDRSILLILIAGYYVPVAEDGVCRLESYS